MSKAFTKEDDDDGDVRLEDLPQSPHANFVTPSGLAALNSRLDARRIELATLQETAEDLLTKLAVATARRDIRFLEGRLDRAILVDSTGRIPGVVAFGAEVDVLDDADNRSTFRIVGEDEAAPAKGLITRFSPLGIVLIGARLGSIVEWKKPQKTVELEIVALRYPSDD